MATASSNDPEFYSLKQTEAYFDRFGWLMSITNRLDRPVYRRLLTLGRFQDCRHVLEIGGGRGVFAATMLGNPACAHTEMVVTELSSVLRRQLHRRLARFGRRAHVISDPGPNYKFADGTFDRIVACFVFEMMEPPTLVEYIQASHRMLREGGLVCLLSVTDGTDAPSRALMAIGKRLAKVSPWLTLGARYRDLEPFFDPEQWTIARCQTVTHMGCSTRITIAQKLTVSIQRDP